MAYNGGCLLGYPMLIPGYTGSYNYIGGSTSSVVGLTPASAISGLVQAKPETCDGCWLPMQNATNSTPGGAASYMRIVTDITRLLAGTQYGLLFTRHTATGATYPTFPESYYKVFTASSTSTTLTAVNSPTLVSQYIPNVLYNNIGEGRRVLISDLPNGYTAIEAAGVGTTWTGNGGLFGELVGVYIAELPNNQELVSFRRETRNPSQQLIKTLDGSQRTYTIGPAGVEITATWRWSDDGVAAGKINAAIANAVSYGLPFLVYIPAGIWYAGPFLDLVIPSQQPTITMPAPGVYELTLTGDCQP